MSTPDFGMLDSISLVHTSSTASSASDSPGKEEALAEFLLASFEGYPHLQNWIEWFKANMPVSYLKRAQNNPSLYRLHLKAIASFCGPDNEGTTTVVRHRSAVGFVVSVLDSQNCPGTLLHNVKNTLPQTETMMHSIDVFCSLDDTVALSVYHYCNDYRQLEHPTETEVNSVIRFAREVQLGRHSPEFLPSCDYSQDRLEAWLRSCTAYYIRCTRVDGVYRMYLFDHVARSTGRILLDWKPEADDLKYDLPLCNADDAVNHVRRQEKKGKLANAFWIYGCVLSVPNLKVLEVACRVLLQHKLNIERAHTDTIWNDRGTPNVLLRFFVFPTEELRCPAREAGIIADTAVSALRLALREVGSFSGSTMGSSCLTSCRRVSVRRDSWSSDDMEFEGEGGAPCAAPSAGYLRKQRRHGLVRYWQRRWVELDGCCLTYRSHRGAHTHKTLDLRTVLCVAEARGHALRFQDQERAVVLRLACASAQEQAEWCQAIKNKKAEFEKSLDSGLSEPKDIDLDNDTLSRYERVASLGRGASCRVWKVRDRQTGDLLAMKVVEKPRVKQGGFQLEALRECGILQALSHPFVAKMHCALETAGKFVLILDYYSGGTLRELLDQWTRIPEASARFYLTELALALRYLHSQAIIHRDLKLNNVLISWAGHAILTDFGIAASGSEADTFCGTPQYLAPEVLAHQPYTRAVDWWCYAVMLHEMLTGALPFASTLLNGNRNTQTGEDANVFLESSAFLSNDAASLLQGLLQEDPARRFGFEEVWHHPFFGGVDWTLAEQAKLPCPFIPDH